MTAECPPPTSRASAPRRRLFAAVCLVACVAAGLRAATEPPAPTERLDQRWRLSAYAEDAGLQRENIFNFDFEPNGTLWLAASGGLYRFDGFRWKHFGVDDGLPSHFVRAVLVSHDGELWVGTDKGAGTFDGRRFDPKGSDRGLAGPSVRRIVEDPDGTLWFCGDRWPDANVTSGLTAYRHGVWTRYTQKDGLPSDHVYNYFRDSEGHQFAMTKDGVAQRFGERWGMPTGGVAIARVEIFAMAEAPGVGVVARGDQMYVFRQQRWESVAIPSSRHFGMHPPLVTTSTGEVLTCDFDGTSFGVYRWTGSDIERVSPVIDARDHSTEFIREAPDGTIWYCAYGTLTRWKRTGGEWSEFVQLPFPRVQDRFGRVWFVDATRAYRLTGSTFEAVPAFAGSVALDGHGDVWSWRDTDHLALCGEVTRTFGEADTGLRQIGSHTLDAQGNSWFEGTDREGRQSAALFDGTTWTRVRLPGSGRAEIVESSPDPTSGVWYLITEEDQRRVTCLHVERQRVEQHTTDYGGIVYGRPHLSVDQAGTLWLSGQAGLYRLERRADAAWQRVEIGGNDVGKGLIRGDEVWFPYNGWSGGESGFAVFRQGQWRHFSGDYSDLLQATPDGTLYVGIEEGLSIIAPGPDMFPSQLTLPAGQRVHSLVKGRNGDLWMGVVEPDGSGPSVLRYRSDHTPPRTEIASLATEVRRDRPLTLRASAREWFVPRDRSHTYRYSWRFDEGAWSPFQVLPAGGISITALPVGPHRLSVRAQDESFDVDPTPAEHGFAVLPIPLQERAWFHPAVLAIFGIIFALGAFAAERARRFARANQQLARAQEKLEERVAERTAELVQSNRQLAAEVAERKHAQRELESVQGRLVDTSRRAGMAEVATSVLHNVGNVLNSINVTVNLTLERVQGSKVASLEKLTGLLDEHAADLGRFITEDPRGRKIPEYISKLAEALRAEQRLTLDELSQLQRHVDHINQIVAMQQSYATISGVVETVPVVDLVEDAIRMNTAALDRHGVELVRDYLGNPSVTLERHKVLQILVNLIRNAKYACDDSGRTDKRVTLRIDHDEQGVAISVCDNGVGIPAENLTRIFGHGFTTRKKGHGFGLHSGALTAKELGGTLAVHSDGPGQGATFTLRLPQTAVAVLAKPA